MLKYVVKPALMVAKGSLDNPSKKLASGFVPRPPASYENPEYHLLDLLLLLL